MSYPRPKPFSFFAHRGHCLKWPENSLPAFVEAFELGAAAVELDVHFVHDELVVFHDFTVDRLTEHSGELGHFSLDTLLAMPILGFDVFMPTLREVFDKLAGFVVINVELKGEGTAAHTVALIREFVDKGRCRASDFLISSYDVEQLLEVRKLCADLPIGVLTRDVQQSFELGHALKAFSFHASLGRLTHKFVDGAHDEGFKVFTFPIDTVEEMEASKALKCDGVFTKDVVLGQRFWD